MTVIVIVPRSALRKTRSDRFACARFASLTDSAVPQRSSRQRSSTRDAVVCKANSNNDSSLSDLATRVSARTFEYDNSPVENAVAITGRLLIAWATRTFSRAALLLRSKRP